MIKHVFSMNPTVKSTLYILVRNRKTLFDATCNAARCTSDPLFHQPLELHNKNVIAKWHRLMHICKTSRTNVLSNHPSVRHSGRMWLLGFRHCMLSIVMHISSDLCSSPCLCLTVGYIWNGNEHRWEKIYETQVTFHRKNQLSRAKSVLVTKA
jgi:hypothetical protein